MRRDFGRTPAGRPWARLCSLVILTLLAHDCCLVAIYPHAPSLPVHGGEGRWTSRGGEQGEIRGAAQREIRARSATCIAERSMDEQRVIFLDPALLLEALLCTLCTELRWLGPPPADAIEPLFCS